MSFALLLAASFACRADTNTDQLVPGQRPIRRGTFNIKFILSSKASANVEGAAEMRFLLDADENWYGVKTDGRTLALLKSTKGTVSVLKEKTVGLPEAAVVLVKRRDERIEVFVDDRKLLTATDGSLKGGTYAWKTAGGFAINDVLLQEVSEIFFADDFMRETRSRKELTQRFESHGSWKPESGRWAVLGPGQPETSAAIFQLCHAGGSATGAPRGVYKTGYWFWDDYICAASLWCGSDGDMAALRFYEYDPRNYFLVQWDGAAARLEVVRVKDGAAAVLAQRPMAFLREQWYRVKLLVRGQRLRVYVDDVLVFNMKLTGAVCGAIALEARGKDVRFDDVQAFSLVLSAKEFADDSSAALREALENAESQEKITAAFATQATMREWATAEGGWEQANDIDWTSSIFYSGIISWSPNEQSARGTVALLAAPELGELKRGYRIVCSFDTGWAEVSTFRNDRLIDTLHLPGRPNKLAIRVESRRLELLADQTVLLKDSLSSDYRGLRFGRCILGAAGGGFATQTSQLIDCPFSRAPSDWITHGIWQLHPRWTCDPRFNWFSGKNVSGMAELWNKYKFEGDYTVEAFVACMLIGNFPTGYVAPINFRVTVGADEMKANRGYTCVYGWIDRPAEILRNGVSVASDNSEVDATLHNDFAQARAEHMHRWWVHMKVQKRGSEVRLYVDQKLWLAFNDPEPLNGPFICISTENNGIMVSRVKITYEKENGKQLVVR